MASLWGCEVRAGSDFVYEPDPVGELQVTQAVLVSGKKCSVTLEADGGKRFTLCTLTPGACDQAKVDMLLGSGNEKVTFGVTADAVVHLTGYTLIPEEYEIADDEDEEDEEEEEEEPVATKTRRPRVSQEQDDEVDLARRVLGSDRIADDDDDDDEDYEEGGDDDDEDDVLDDDDDDDEEEGGGAMDLFGGDEDDEQLPFEKDEEEPQEKKTKKKKRKAPEEEESGAPEAAPKKRKTEHESTPEDEFKATLVSYLSDKGPSPLSRVGNDCKKPSQVKGKLKAFLQNHADTFEIEGLNVKLKK